ncbi:hypothetical protein HMH01_11960 [Halovulum dunhuangense]|uniref:Uncharacterized protein n=1 Tax=Halovulum dunhuangense TaxID=1505036 RepID=A0A849L4M2_9RHOB|nr:hypothetical protein [Halovulum dunhuangense]NNU81150.1 hypothetical protein [Halovulum dunhuangense]
MEDRKLAALAERIEAADALDAHLAREAAHALDEIFAGRGLLEALRADGAAGTDAVLRLIDLALPGWQVRLSGTAHGPGGRWTCTLREVGLRDDDESIGVGKGTHPAQALMAALLLSAARRGA